MTILKVMVEDDQADELKKILHEIDIVKAVQEEEQNGATVENSSAYSRIKSILDAARGKELFKDIDDPVEWQRNIRKEWERDF